MYASLAPALLILYNVAFLLGLQCSRISSRDARGLCSIAAGTAKWTTALGFVVATLVWVYGLVRSQGLVPVALPLFVAGVLAYWFQSTLLVAELTKKYKPAKSTAQIVAIAAIASLLLATVAGFSDLAR